MENKEKISFLIYLYKKRRIIFIITIIISIYLTYSASRIKFREDIIDLLPSSDPVISEYKTILTNFKFIDLIYINMSSSDKNNKLSPEELASIADTGSEEMQRSGLFKKIVYKTEYSEIIKALEFLREHRENFFTSTDEEVLKSRLNKETIKNIILNYKKMLIESPNPGIVNQIKNDPAGIDESLFKKMQSLKYIGGSLNIYNGRIYSKTFDDILIMAQPIYPSTDSRHSAELIKFLENLFSSLKKESGEKIRISYISGHRFALVNSEQVKNDLKLIILISTVSIAFICFLAFYRPLLILLTFLPAFFGGLLAAGLIRFFNPQISAISIGCGTIVLGICVDYGIHILFHIDDAIKEDYSRENIFAIIKSISSTLIICSFTTIAAFLSLKISSLPIYKDLGIFAAIGIIGSIVFSLIVLPLIIPVHDKNKGKKMLIDIVKYYPFIFRWIKDKRKLIVFFVTIFTLFSLAGLTLIEFEGDIQKLNFQTPEIKNDWDYVLHNFGDAMASTNFVVYAGSENEALQKNELLYSIFTELKEKSLIESFSSSAKIFLSEDTQKQNIERWNKFWNDERIKDITNILYESASELKMRPEHFGNFIKSLKRNTTILKTDNYKPELFKDILSSQIRSTDKGFMFLTSVKLYSPKDFNTIYEDVKSKIPDVISFSGKNFMRHVISLIYNELFKLGILVFAVIFLFLFISMRNIKEVLAVIIPLIVSLIWTFGILGWLGIKINIMNSIIIIFIFGLVDDYSIFFSQAWKKSDDIKNPHLSRASGGIMISALTTLSGFAALACAKYPPFQTLGLTAAMGILLGMLAVLTIIPLLYKK